MARYGLRGGAFLRHGAAPPSPPSLRGREAAEAIQWALPHVRGGRRTVLPCPILDCFALASLALAMTERRPCRESWAGGGGTAAATVIARRRSRRTNPVGPCRM